jgi:hypothetical protein
VILKSDDEDDIMEIMNQNKERANQDLLAD